MDEAKISVIVPIYRVERYLCRCIESIVAQTHENMEIILVDDGSPDGCGAICDQYAQRDGRIVVIHQENAGVSAARNAGLRIATGEWIGFVDGDDWVEPDMYAYLLKLAQTHGAGVSQCGLFQDEPGGGEERFSADEETVLFEDIGQWSAEDWKGVSNSACNKLYRADCLRDILYDPDCFVGEDLRFNLCVLLEGKGLVLGNRTMYHYVQHEDSACHAPPSAAMIHSHHNMLLQAREMADIGAVARRRFQEEWLKIGMHICSQTLRFPEQGLEPLLEQLRADLRQEIGILLIRSGLSPRMRAKAVLIAWGWPLYRGLREVWKGTR